MLKRVYVWEVPVRLVHFFNWWCIGILTVTGFNMGTPFLVYILGRPYVMAWMKQIHFTTAYVFTSVFMIRMYWLIAGNRYASWRGILLLKKARWKELYEEILVYSFLKKRTTESWPGHTGMASLSYLIMFILFFFQIATGFGLYSQSHVGAFWRFWGGTVFSILNPQYVRLAHHMFLWVIVLFVSAHFYIAWENEVRVGNSAKSSIFSGYKLVDEE